jgi:hypothetical protein
VASSVIAIQISKALKMAQVMADSKETAHLVAPLMAVAKVMERMRELKCELCHAPGHTISYCWFNGMLYDLCHREGKSYDHAVFR